MKRIIVSVCAVAILAGLLAAPASAAVKHFQGNVNGGGTVEFDVLFKQGKPKAAGFFDFDNIPVTCDGGETDAFYSTENAVRVTRKRKFTYRFNFGDDSLARVSGRISKNGKRASGTTIRANADLEGLTSCTTGGARRWNAST